MDDRIDVTKRKPRRLRGTPALSFVNRASLIVLGVGVALGLAVTVPFDAVKIVKERYGFDMINVSEKEYAKRALFTQGLGERKSGEQILAILKENELKEEEKLKQQQ